MRKLKAMVVKELKDLLRDRTTMISIIVIPLIMFPLMGMAFAGARQVAPQTVTVAVLNLDEGPLGGQLVDYLRNAPQVKVVELNETAEDYGRLVLRLHYERGIDELLVIPRNFSRLAGNPYSTGSLYYYAYASPGGSYFATSADQVVESYKRLLIQMRIKMLNETADPPTVLTPFYVSYVSMVGEKPILSPPTIVKAILASQKWTIPIATMIVIMTSMQIVAAAVASEKEAKTLETLLSTPISRLSILGGKVISSIVIAIVSGASYMVGFTIYMNMVTGQAMERAIPPELVGEVNSILLGPRMMFGMGALMVMALITAIAIAVSLSVYAEDVRSAQALVSYISLLIWIPAMFVMSADPELLPLGYRLALYAVPFTHAFVGVNRIIDGNYTAIAIGVAYMAAFSLAFMYIAAKSFTTEKILTVRLRIFRRRRAE